MMQNEEIVCEGLLSVKQARQFLGIGLSTTYRLMDAGKLRYVKIGRIRRIPKNELIRISAENLQGGWDSKV